MICTRCGSSNTDVQVISKTVLVDKHHSLMWWLLIGWWWIIIKWTFFTIPALIFKIFGRKKQVAINKHKALCVCKNCGHIETIQ